MSISGSSNEPKMSAKLNIPMPTPGTSQAPYFKGKRVTDFLESLEVHVSAAQIAFDQLPKYILRYSHSSKIALLKPTSSSRAKTGQKLEPSLLISMGPVTRHRFSLQTNCVHGLRNMPKKLLLSS